VAVFAAPRERAAQPRGRQERRIAQLAFIAPPIGARINAVQELYGIGSADLAARHSAAWSCRDLIASMMGMLQPWAFALPAMGMPTPTPGPAMGLGTTGTPQKIKIQPVILNEPSADMDIGDFLYASTFALIQGNVYGGIVNRDRLGFPSQIELQDNGRVQVRRLADGSKEVKFGGQVQDPASVWHKSIFRPAGALTGLSILQAAHRSMTLGVNAQDFGNGFFEEGAHPSGLLLNDSEDEFSQEDAQTVKQKFMAAVHGSREPVVMTGGWKYQQVQVNPSDSQFIDTQGISDLQVCRYHRVWPEMVAVPITGSSITYANVEQRALDFLTYTMQRWVTWWERKLGALLPAGQYVKFDLSPLLRTDIMTRWVVNHAMIGSRTVTQDEVRAGEDMAPLTDAQRDQVNAMPLQPMLPRLSQGL
jgi:HK97 family phage portal protein